MNLTPRRLAAGAALALLTVGLTGCTSAPAGLVSVTGTVSADVDVIAVPSVATPVVDTSVGFTTATSGATAPAPTSDVGTVVGLGSLPTITSMQVSVGDRVSEGDPVATLDPRLLDAQVAVTEAALGSAKARVGALDAALDDAADAATTITDNQTTVDDAITNATSAETDLANGLRQARDVRAQLIAKLVATRQLLENYPPTAPPGTPTQAELRAAVAQLNQKVAEVDKNIAKATSAQATLKGKLSEAYQARSDLKDAAAQVRDARSQLSGARDLARIGVDAAEVSVSLAKAQRDQTTLVATTSGLIVDAAHAGDHLAPGAPLVKIRPDGPRTVVAWLSPTQSDSVCLDDPATLTGDWMPADADPATGTLTWMAPGLTYPPTDTTTDEIHLLRARQVEITTDADLPAGAPVDVTITGCQTTAAPTETNG